MTIPRNLNLGLRFCFCVLEAPSVTSVDKVNLNLPSFLHVQQLRDSPGAAQSFNSCSPRPSATCIPIE